MNSKLKAYLDSLTPEQRSIVVEKLGSIAVESPEEKLANVIRRAAGLPEVNANEGEGEDLTARAARKAAGLE